MALAAGTLMGGGSWLHHPETVVGPHKQVDRPKDRSHKQNECDENREVFGWSQADIQPKDSACNHEI
jgi:hypothetical protein